MISDDVKTLYNQSKWALVVRGLFGVALGLFIIARPFDSVAALALVIAIWALADGIVSGIALLTGASRMQSFHGDVNRAMRSTIRT